MFTSHKLLGFLVFIAAGIVYYLGWLSLSILAPVLLFVLIVYFIAFNRAVNFVSERIEYRLVSLMVGLTGNELIDDVIIRLDIWRSLEGYRKVEKDLISFYKISYKPLYVSFFLKKESVVLNKFYILMRRFYSKDNSYLKNLFSEQLCVDHSLLDWLVKKIGEFQLNGILEKEIKAAYGNYGQQVNLLSILETLGLTSQYLDSFEYNILAYRGGELVRFMNETEFDRLKDEAKINLFSAEPQNADEAISGFLELAKSFCVDPDKAFAEIEYEFSQAMLEKVKALPVKTNGAEWLRLFKKFANKDQLLALLQKDSRVLVSE